MRLDHRYLSKTWALPLALAAAFSILMLQGQVDPPHVEAALAPGQTVEIDKFVDVPDFPPKLDVFLLVDLSGSYFDDLPNIKALAPGIFDSVKANVADVRFGLGSFVDFPFSPWGSSASGDYAYRLDQNLTPTKAAWVSAVNAMFTRFGNDFPESQYEALFQAATGAGRDVVPPGLSPGDIAPGQGPSFRSDATKIIIITTDAFFHNAGDPGPFPYPGPSAAAATAALQSAGIKVIALKAPGSGSQMDAVAAATGGSVQPTTSTSSDIADAILAALESLTFDITAAPQGCGPLEIDYDPPLIEDVSGPLTVEFLESIAVPGDVAANELNEDGEVHCLVEFLAGDAVIGEQTIWITVRREAAIDIKPGSFPNSINPSRTRGVIPVAVLGSEEFDVMDIDTFSLAFGPLGAPPAHNVGNPPEPGHLEDVNGDGFTDLVTHHIAGETGIASGDTEACLTGKTLDGINFQGCDSVRTVGR